MTARPTAERARTAVALVFVLNGVVFASWVSRLPAVRDALSLTTGELGLLLLCLSAGSVLGLPLAGPLSTRLGPDRTVVAGAGVVGVGLLLVARGVSGGDALATGVGLGLTGLGVGVWDVAMNVEAAGVERALGRVLMPRFHAGFSIGTVLGALLGAAAAALDVGVPVQLSVTGLVAVLVVTGAVRAFLPVTAEHADRQGLSTAAAWREPRTLAVGLLVLCFAFAEGTANDWLAVALVDGHGESGSTGALGFACFVSTMTLVRATGGALLARHGRPAVLRASAALAAVGVALVVTGPSLPVVLLGALAWGAGSALGFPVGMSAAADDPRGAAVRVSVVSSIGYTAFLAGPPLVGLLAEPQRLGVLPSLLVVLVALVLGSLVAARTAPATATVRAQQG
ncbi:MAG: MFS transporter [Mycobacteriales bacterium]|nr:MFS transporter [Mycobacteriales bacterium]